ncbi:MAG: acetyltransferase [Planctomycetota bacterium]
MTALFVFGAGGHGKVVADAATRAGFEVLGFLDDAPGTHGKTVLGLPVLGSASWLAGRPAHAVALGVGDNEARRGAYVRLRELGATLPVIVHGAAVVAESATLGDGVVVCATAVVNPDAVVGSGAILNTACVVEHDVEVGPFAHVSPNAALGGAARLGARAQLGLGAAVLPGVKVGEGTIVGAGAVVVRDLPPGVVAWGVPARVARRIQGWRQ